MNHEATGMATMEKWLVDVQCDGCKGLFYRSAPNVIVPDADWPRNGDVVMGYEIPDTPGTFQRQLSPKFLCERHLNGLCGITFAVLGWIRLQNGYYLPMQSDDGKVQFLFKVSKRAQPNNAEMKRIGSNTPLFRGPGGEKEEVASLLGHTVAVVESGVNGESASSQKTDIEAETTAKEGLRAAVHMDAMAFGMGCCCLQITFQAKDVDESRFLFDQLNVMAPM
jgi:hypothetical protein